MIPYFTLIKIPGAKNNSYEAKIPRKNSQAQKKNFLSVRLY